MVSSTLQAAGLAVLATSPAVLAAPPQSSTTQPLQSSDWWWWPFGGNHHHDHNKILTDLPTISQYFAQLTPYHDNPDDRWGVRDVGLPDGCQIEQVHTLQRHAQRYPVSKSNGKLAQKVQNFTAANPDAKFEGPLAFLNSYTYTLGTQYLTGVGATTEFASGVSFWNRYGRTLYNATVDDLQYNPIAPDGTPRQKPLLRTTSQSRIQNSQISWALGFFGPSFKEEPDAELKPFVDGTDYDRLVIPEGGIENDTLAGSDACLTANIPNIGAIGQQDTKLWIPLYAKDAAARLTKMAPKGFTFEPEDINRMQSLCAYDIANIGQSDFCTFFTEDEWRGFELSADLYYYYSDSWGSPIGRSYGVGYHQELLARLTNQYIKSSNSSVNSTLDDNATTFPLHRPFYADFSHDDFVVAALTSMSIDYFHEKPNFRQYPVDPHRRFRSSDLVPFGSRLITEVIGCSNPNPTAFPTHRVQYTPTQYGYDAAKAEHKFVRMRLNNGILPLSTMRYAQCGRSDGLCDLGEFVRAGYKNAELANFQFGCFSNYTVVEPTKGQDFDGRVDKNTKGVEFFPGEWNEENIQTYLQ